MNLMDKKLLFFLGFVLAIIFLLLAARPWISQLGNPSFNHPVFKSKTPAWQVKKNEKIGYQVSYPEDWLIDEWDMEEAANLKNVPDGSIYYQSRFSGDSGHFEILVWENKSQAKLRTWLTWFRHEDLALENVPQQENFTISGQPAILSRQLETSRGKPVLYIFFAYQDKIYELNFEGEELLGVEISKTGQQGNAVYDKIMQSFIFVVK
jgi:hypothetical protein